VPRKKITQQALIPVLFSASVVSARRERMMDRKRDDRPGSRGRDDLATPRLSDYRPRRPDERPGSRPAFNDAESPLTWLRARRGKDGRPLVSDEQFLAGERLRADFERSMMARRTTSNWDLAAGRSPRGPDALDISDAALAARQRFHKAMAAVGPELSGILHRVCCMAEGLEQAERALDLPARSGKAVLGLALTALARHYGLLHHDRRGSGAINRWALDGCRPEIRQAELEDA
jgi:hypothetical protein